MNIKKVIKAQGWTLERLAAEMTSKDGKKGISQPSVSSIINGNPTIDKLQEIASIIGVSVSELVSDTDKELNALIQYGENYYTAKSVEELERIVTTIKTMK